MSIDASQQLIAACAFGLEALVKRELIRLGYEPHVLSPGRVGFTGDAAAICRSNIGLRFADRVLVEIASFPAPDFDALFETTKAIDWSRWIPVNGKFPVVGKSRLSKLTSLPAVQRSVKRAVVESLKAGHGTDRLPEDGAEFRIEVALLKDEARLTIDTTGPSLHKRGYRKLAGIAPLKETLAAAMVDLSVWNHNRPLVDPFCGSGTIPIEAAMIGLNIAPGINRRFTAQKWPVIQSQFWNQAVEEAMDLPHRDRQLQIIGSDHDPEAISLARYHAQQAGVAEQLHLQVKPFDQLRSKRDYGCVVTNPPYGERIRPDDLEKLYRSFPAVLQRLPTWSHFVLTNEPKFERIVQKQATRRRKLFNGRIECTYFQFLGPRPPSPESKNHLESEPHPDSELEIREESPASNSPDVVFGGLSEKDHEQAALFCTRLQKRARHLRRWPTKRGIGCYRIYERDIPELPFVVDRYEDNLHITEYERPHDRDLGHHAAWLELMKKAAAKAIELPIQRVHLKSRERVRGGQQFQRLSTSGKRTEVGEAGLQFLVNFTDYVDTGLFLDHRVARSMVRDLAEDRNFLNLFAYTGSFSVYAAAGGALSTTTVDLSSNYLAWAEENMKRNGFQGSQHTFVESDALVFLNGLPSVRRYDLVVVDPPTFSNSKGLRQDWDVQRDHVQLLDTLHKHLAPGGIVFFSTNFRRFKLSDAISEKYSVREITKQTIPEDFRNRRIHQCWRLETKDS